MAEQTVGQEEDGKAFEAIMHEWYALKRDPLPSFRRAMRFAWDAGVGRGLELRGCCEERDA